MTKSGFDLDEIERLLAAAEDSDLTDGGRYFADTCEDLTRCRHGEIGEYVDPRNGEALEALWNARKAMLTEIRELRAENARLKEALDEDGLAEIITDTLDMDWQPRWAAQAIRRAALGEPQ